MYCRFQTVISPQIIILKFVPQIKIHTTRKIAFKKQNLEHKCTLQETCIVLLITISYVVGILRWLQHTFTERRNHEIRGRACLLTGLQNIRFDTKNDRPKVYISFCNIVLTLAIIYYTLQKTWHFHTGNYTRRNRSDGGQSQVFNSVSYSHHL